MGCLRPLETAILAIVVLGAISAHGALLDVDGAWCTGQGEVPFSSSCLNASLAEADANTSRTVFNLFLLIFIFYFSMALHSQRGCTPSPTPVLPAIFMLSVTGIRLASGTWECCELELAAGLSIETLSGNKVSECALPVQCLCAMPVCVLPCSSSALCPYTPSRPTPPSPLLYPSCLFLFRMLCLDALPLIRISCSRCGQTPP